MTEISTAVHNRIQIVPCPKSTACGLSTVLVSDGSIRLNRRCRENDLQRLPARAQSVAVGCDEAAHVPANLIWRLQSEVLSMVGRLFKWVGRRLSASEDELYPTPDHTRSPQHEAAH